MWIEREATSRAGATAHIPQPQPQHPSNTSTPPTTHTHTHRQTDTHTHTVIGVVCGFNEWLPDPHQDSIHMPPSQLFQVQCIYTHATYRTPSTPLGPNAQSAPQDHSTPRAQMAACPQGTNDARAQDPRPIYGHIKAIWH